MLALFAAMLLPGAGRPDPSPWPRILKDTVQPAQGRAMVLGSIRLFKGEKTRKCSKMLSECSLIILPPDGDRAMAYPFDGDEPFSWSLPPGEYMILGLEVNYPGTTTTPLRMMFTMPEGAGAVYIGDIALVSQDERMLIGVHNGFEEATTGYKEAHPEAVAGPVSGMIAPEPEMGTAERIHYVCAADWGIACTDSFRGVTPAYPPAVRGFDPVDSLTPRFQWQASTDPAVSYDLALYQAATYRGIKDSHIIGRLISYQQGLTAPSWQIDRPLEPGHEYYWSVRLRRGATVSNWSTHSYSHFYIIAWSSGYGQWFNFSTPPAAP